MQQNSRLCIGKHSASAEIDKLLLPEWYTIYYIII